jgi:hypothetical protein
LPEDEPAGVHPSVSTTPARPARIDDRLLALLRSFLQSSWRIGRDPGAQLERLSRSFLRRTVDRAIASPVPIADQAALAAALDTPRSDVLLSTTSSALIVGKVLRRVGPLKGLAKRTPMLAAATAVPEVYTSLSGGVDEVTAVASFLALRVRETGASPDADRIRRVTVQLLDRRHVNPDLEPEHDQLVWSWLKRAGRGLLPFADRGRRSNAARIASVAAALDPATLQAL